MFTLEEKQYLLALLQERKRKFLFRKCPAIHDKLIDKIAQMIRNEQINAR